MLFSICISSFVSVIERTVVSPKYVLGPLSRISWLYIDSFLNLICWFLCQYFFVLITISFVILPEINVIPPVVYRPSPQTRIPLDFSHALVDMISY